MAHNKRWVVMDFDDGEPHVVEAPSAEEAEIQYAMITSSGAHLTREEAIEGLEDGTVGNFQLIGAIDDLQQMKPVR